MADSSAPPTLNARRSIGRRVVGWFLATSILLAIMAGFVYHNIYGLIEQGGWVVHTHEVLASLQDIHFEVNDAQANVRSYVLTNQKEYLSSYRVSRGRIHSNLRQLRSLTADNAPQQRLLDRLEILLKTRLELADDLAQIFHTDGFAMAQDEIRSGRGEKLNKDVGAVIEEMENEEKLLLNQRELASRAATEMTVLGVGGCLLAVFFILMFVFWLIRREGRRRELTEASLHDINRKLEVSLHDTKRLTQETTVIAAMGDYLQACRTPQEAYGVLTRTIPKLLPGVAGAVGIISNSRNLVETVFTWGNAGGFDQEFEPDECWGLRRGRMHLVADASGCDPVCTHFEAPPSSYLCLPMVVHGETLGVLSLLPENANGFGETERRAAKAVAEQVSLALANLRLQEALRAQSLRDPLTGLFNRRYLEASLEREISRARRAGGPLAVVMIDVDHFKRFNDTHGHEAGDCILAAFGKLATRSLREEDIPCRYGGEEFCLVLPGADLKIAHSRVEEIREAVKNLHVSSRHQQLGPITVSAGVAVFPDNGDVGEAVVRAADTALYRAKRAGRDRVSIADRTELAPLSSHDEPPTHRNGAVHHAAGAE